MRKLRPRVRALKLAIAAILRAKKEQIDFGYIEEWTTRLGLSSLWKEMLDSIV
jgi:hypothetical protein